MKAQRGGFVLGLIVGLLVGLALALGVALYITKVPVPFIDKVPQRTAEQDSAEAARNKNWNPNAPLAEKIMPPPAAGPAASAASEAAAAASMPAVAATPPVTPAPAATPAHPGEDPAAILSGAPAAQPFVYYVQVGAFTRAEEAEQQRAKMAIIGYATKVTRQSQSGRDVYRVRTGPVRDARRGREHAGAAAGCERRRAAGAGEPPVSRARRNSRSPAGSTTVGSNTPSRGHS